MSLLRCLGEAFAAKGLKVLAGVLPLGSVLVEIVGDTLERYRRLRREGQILADAEALIQASAEEVRADAERIAREVLAERPVAEVVQLQLYLTQVPAAARQSLKRPADPSGKTIPGQMNLLDSAQLASLLPKRMPRFQAGESVPDAPQWQFVELLGAGGFGEVWLAHHRFMEQRRAFKFCLDETARERLLKHEANIIQQVMKASVGVRDDRHGIVPLLDAYLSGETPWLAYEYVDGGDLATVVRESAQLPAKNRAERSIEVLAALAEVVGQLHMQAQPIIHRDLKPANVLVKRHGNKSLLRVTDFGISHIASDVSIRQASVSTPIMHVGETYRGAFTPIYASPQQKRGMKPDVRDDVHALGIIGWQLLLGDLGAERPAGKWRKRLAECELSDAVLDVLESCWDDDPNERPANASVLAEGLRQTLQKDSIAPASVPAKSQAQSHQQQVISVPRQAEGVTAGETWETFEYIINDTEKRQGKRRVRTLDLGAGVMLKLVRIPKGRFQIGPSLGEGAVSRDNERSLKAEITQDYYLGMTPVTQAQYEALMGNNPSKFTTDLVFRRDSVQHDTRLFPVDNVSYEDAMEFCAKLSKKTGLSISLPTETQWERACRAGTDTPFHFGSILNGQHANHDGDSPYGTSTKGPRLQRPSAVGSYLPNGYGLYDIHGNVWEWCRDWYAPLIESDWPDPERKEKYSQDSKVILGGIKPDRLFEDRKVIRGGTFADRGDACRAAVRLSNYRTGSAANLGFRVSAVCSD